MRPKIAVITTVYRPLSHTDVIVSRWLEPRPTDPQFGWPRDGQSQPATQIASFYIEQFHQEGRNIDIGREKAAHYGVPIYATVAEALCLGTGELAVNGVLLIGEHGEYPTNEWNQKLYPRRQLFDAIVAVFRESGRGVPVFNDKHLSYDLASAHHMFGTALEMGFPLMAGSSVPVAGFAAPWNVAPAAELREGFGVFFRGADINGYHDIEWLQSLVAARAGGESGIESVTAYTGESFENALAEGAWSHDLMRTAFEAAHKNSAQTYLDALKESDRKRQPHPLTAALVFRHRDGFQSTYFFSAVQPAEFLVAVAEKNGTLHGGCSHLSRSSSAQFCPHFAVLCAHIEEFFESGQTPFPLEHSLMTTLMTRAACHALTTPGEVRHTPELDFAYRTDFEAPLYP